MLFISIMNKPIPIPGILSPVAPTRFTSLLNGLICSAYVAYCSDISDQLDPESPKTLMFLSANSLPSFVFPSNFTLNQIPFLPKRCTWSEFISAFTCELCDWGADRLNGSEHFLYSFSPCDLFWNICNRLHHSYLLQPLFHCF